MCNFTLPLKAAGIPVFAVSTWWGVPVLQIWHINQRSCRNTDYVLVPKESADGAVDALTQDGWEFVQGNQQ